MSIWTTFELPGARHRRRRAVHGQRVPERHEHRERAELLADNAIASYAVNSHLTLRVNGSNLADEEYVDRIGGGHYVPGPGRQVMVTATIRR